VDDHAVHLSLVRARFYLLAPLFLSNILVNAYMAVNDIGVNIHTLPLVTVDSLWDRLRAVHRQPHHRGDRVRGDLTDSVREAIVTSARP